jgi:hypothetical protein
LAAYRFRETGFFRGKTEVEGYAATQPDLGWTSKTSVEAPERFSMNHSAAAWASSRKSLGSTGAA